MLNSVVSVVKEIVPVLDGAPICAVLNKITFVVGDELGKCVGDALGFAVVGLADGELLVGDKVGVPVGLVDGAEVGAREGVVVGFAVVGLADGELLGLAVGDKVGSPVGLVDGATVGACEGAVVGPTVGSAIERQLHDSPSFNSKPTIYCSVLDMWKLQISAQLVAELVS